MAADVRDYSSLYNAIRRSEVELSEFSMNKRMAANVRDYSSLYNAICRSEAKS
jgi:hypothetical protein